DCQKKATYAEEATRIGWGRKCPTGARASCREMRILSKPPALAVGYFTDQLYGGNPCITQLT
ncbi:MAG TPA: hypothetical protein VHZ51_01050, partial [Ktedonobacteraceae bacterium]|nr:hypothetical protein [Ktedonobacteraceae bacterium]